MNKTLFQQAQGRTDFYNKNVPLFRLPLRKGSTTQLFPLYCYYDTLILSEVYVKSQSLQFLLSLQCYSQCDKEATTQSLLAIL